MTTAMKTPLEFPARETPEFAEGEVYFIGNATTIIRYAGFTLLTDPAFMHRGDFADLGHGIYAQRVVEPACQISDLPWLDMIVLSHFHGDHFDHVSLRRLNKDLPIVSTYHAVQELRANGFARGYALDTWESLPSVKGEAQLRVTSVPGKHAPDPLSGLLPPVMGSVLDFSRDGDHMFRMYISGDTLLHDRLYDIPTRFPDIDLALIHIGGTALLTTVVTMTGAQGVRAVEIVKPRVAAPIHYNDFSVFMSGLEDFKNAAAVSKAPTEFHYLSHGEIFRFHPMGGRRSDVGTVGRGAGRR
jgi:L-ascorbate metabolism protein UlaG (beta-lactamase superfamily)